MRNPPNKNENRHKNLKNKDWPQKENTIKMINHKPKTSLNINSTISQEFKVFHVYVHKLIPFIFCPDL